MAPETVSKIYGKPRFGFIVGLFVAFIVLLLVIGWLFMRTDTPNMRSRPRRTGMTLLLQGMPQLR